MEKLKVNFDNYDLTEYIDVLQGFNRGIGSERSLSMSKIGKNTGQVFNYITQNEKVITMPFRVKDMSNGLRRSLAYILDVDEPKRLVFGDEPDKYYLAIPTDVKLEESEHQVLGEITWIIPEGFAYAFDTKAASNKQANGTLTNSMSVDNKGNFKAYPVLRSTIKGENGVVTFINSNGGVLQFGNPEELDGFVATRSDRVLNAPFEGKLPNGSILNSGITEYPVNVSGQNNVMSGSFKWTNPDTAIPVWSNTGINARAWNGPAFTVPLGKNSNDKDTEDFQFVTRVNFKPNVKEMTRLEINLNDGLKHFCGVTLRDSTRQRSEFIVEFAIDDQVNGRSFTMDTKKFDGHFFEIQIKRQGNKLTFQVGRIDTLKNGVNLKKGAVFSKTYTDDSYRGRRVANAFFWAMRYGTGQVGRIEFTDTKFTWVNTKYWKEISNLYQDGDELTIDVKERTLYLNGVEAIEPMYHSINNEWEQFVLNQGLTEVQVIHSSWSEMPECSIEFQETYI